MNKKEFIKYLEDKLFYLVDNEKSKVIEKYSSVIDNYVNMGQSEVDAIASLGNLDDIITATYLSHGLDYKKINDGKTTLKGFKGALINFYKNLTSNDKSKVKSSILYFLYLMIVVVILKVLFILVRDVGTSALGEIISGKVINKIYYLFFDITYVIVAVMVFVKMFTKKFK